MQYYSAGFLACVSTKDNAFSYYLSTMANYHPSPHSQRPDRSAFSTDSLLPSPKSKALNNRKDSID